MTYSKVFRELEADNRTLWLRTVEGKQGPHDIHGTGLSLQERQILDISTHTAAALAYNATQIAWWSEVCRNRVVNWS